MIFVTIGTTKPFDRLLRVVDRLADTDEEVIVQCGDSSTRPRRATCVSFLAYEDLADHVQRARVVVSHAGVGTIMTALRLGKTPVVVPRRGALGEAVDDHQVELARKLAEAGTVVLVEDPDDLPAAIAEEREASAAQAQGGDLVDEIRSYLSGVIGPPATTPPIG
jgi:UDP-N-acetylglucosamine transferase subunit ALG13